MCSSRGPRLGTPGTAASALQGVPVVLGAGSWQEPQREWQGQGPGSERSLWLSHFTTLMSHTWGTAFGAFSPSPGHGGRTLGDGRASEVSFCLSAETVARCDEHVSGASCWGLQTDASDPCRTGQHVSKQFMEEVLPAVTELLCRRVQRHTARAELERAEPPALISPEGPGKQTLGR